MMRSIYLCKDMTITIKDMTLTIKTMFQAWLICVQSTPSRNKSNGYTLHSFVHSHSRSWAAWLNTFWAWIKMIQVLQFQGRTRK